MNPPNSVAPPAGDATQSSAETVYAQHRRQSVLAAVEAEQLDWQITASEAEIAAIAADIQREKERAQQLRRHHLRLDRLHAELQQRNRQAKASYEQLDGKLAQMHDIDRTADAASKQRQEDIAAALVKMGDLKAQIVKGNEQLEGMKMRSCFSVDSRLFLLSNNFQTPTSCWRSPAPRSTPCESS